MPAIVIARSFALCAALVFLSVNLTSCAPSCQSDVAPSSKELIMRDVLGTGSFVMSTGGFKIMGGVQGRQPDGHVIVLPQEEGGVLDISLSAGDATASGPTRIEGAGVPTGLRARRAEEWVEPGVVFLQFNDVTMPLPDGTVAEQDSLSIELHVGATESDS